MIFEKRVLVKEKDLQVDQGIWDNATDTIPDEDPTATPDGHCSNKQEYKSNSSTNWTTIFLGLPIQSDTHHPNPGHIEKVVPESIKRASSECKVWGVKVVSFVCVEPVGCDEEGKEGNDPFIFDNGFHHSLDFGPSH